MVSWQALVVSQGGCSLGAEVEDSMECQRPQCRAELDVIRKAEIWEQRGEFCKGMVGEASMF